MADASTTATKCFSDRRWLNYSLQPTDGLQQPEDQWQHTCIPKML